MGLTAAAIAIPAALTLLGTAQRAGAEREAGELNKKIARRNADLARIQERAALERGEREANRVRTQQQQVIGAQRAALAAQGIFVDTGTAANLQEDTRRVAEEDIIRIRNNARMEAWGYKNEIKEFEFEEELIGFGTQAAIQTTILGGVTQATNIGFRGVG